MGQTKFRKVALIGLGLMGSSLALAIKRASLAEQVVGIDHSMEVRETARRLGLATRITGDLPDGVRDADLVVLCTPIGTFGGIVDLIAPHLAPETILTDVGSVKHSVIQDLAGRIPDHVVFVPGHPVAGTEQSGPEAGFAELFDGRNAVLTPLPQTPPQAVDRVAWLWEACGCHVERMTALHHDQIMAIVSHLPHLIAYTIVSTATDLEESERSEVIKYSAGGFRDFTRIAASDPVMWRDIFLANKEAVLEMLQRFNEDLTALQRAIRWDEGETLERLFARTRTIRRSIIDAKQAGTFRPTEPTKK